MGIRNQLIGRYFLGTIRVLDGHIVQTRFDRRCPADDFGVSYVRDNIKYTHQNGRDFIKYCINSIDEERRPELREILFEWDKKFALYRIRGGRLLGEVNAEKSEIIAGKTVSPPPMEKPIHKS